MKNLIFCALIITVCIAVIRGDDRIIARSKRAVDQFGQMIKCGTGLVSIDLVYKRYNRYGCYCGLGGSGVPIDDIDRCCEIHDACYASVHANHSSACNRTSNEIYWRRYHWQCENVSAHENASSIWKRLQSAVRTSAAFLRHTGNLSKVDEKQIGVPRCLGTEKSSCARAVCKCDLAAALCFATLPYPEQKQACHTNQLSPSPEASSTTTDSWNTDIVTDVT